ncbi:MAG: hypothetical protein CFE43_06365 [Burkholderiales bacterium PBB3]|nr:MAG: hypothetical protein CFE43_06365 [Burkholderiales bacterium PBB3]
MRALRIGLLLLGSTLLALAAVLGALWLWSGATTSLATTLAVAARWLPEGQSLQSRNVQGSLQGGGSIGWLRWQRGALSVEAHDIAVNWSWRSALDGQARVDQLSARLVHIEDKSPAQPGPKTAPTAIALPFKVDTRWSIDTLEWAGGAPITATGLAGHYVFDGQRHSLQKGQANVAQGSYQFSATLDAQAPMALAAQVQGTVQTAVPGRATPLEVVALATLVGPLAGADATLELQASLRSDPATTTDKRAAPVANTGMQGQLSARVQPWQAQPVVQANASWQSLDLAALWPQAPQARLSGQAQVKPSAPPQPAGWNAVLQISNAQPGPWDKQRLPLEQLDAQLDYTQGQWAVRALQARGAGGRLEAQGQVRGSTADAAQATVPGWQGQAKLWGVNTAALDSRLASAVLDGELTATQADTGIAFKADIRSPTATATSTATPATGPVRLQRLQASGTWAAPLLQIDALALQTDDALLDGKLTIHTARPQASATGQLNLALPGARATASGSMAAATGDGSLQLQVTDASQTRRWLARLPGAPVALAKLQVKGDANLDARWTGGWQTLSALQLQISARVPRLEGFDTAQPDKPWRVRDGQLDLSGPVAALNLSTQGQLERANQRLTWKASAQGGREDDGNWQARLESAQISAQLSVQLSTPPNTAVNTQPPASDSSRPAPWTLQLAEPVTVRYQSTASSRSLEGSAGSLRLGGPVPGSALVSWQTARWSQDGMGSQARTQWSTQGRLTDVPLAWLEVFSPTRLADLGVRGDVVFGGQWDANSSDTLRLRAHVERTAGDLQLLGESDSSALLSAGLRVARLELANEGEQISASLRWDSERAGQVQASFGTRVTLQDEQWAWAADAPISGQLKAQLPRVGAWSVLAPPGWRLRGTLDADATLAGTRARPQWRGHLSASDLALRSVVDGVDFSGGTLRTRLEGERLNIEEFTLQGAGGVGTAPGSGGLLSATGFVQWQTPEGASANPDAAFVQRLRMEMDATATALRVSARGDRRLVLSGTLSARLNAAKLVLRGKLKADQALFVMPEDTTPRLGDDVVVRKPAAAANPAPVPTQAGATPAKSNTPVQTDLAISLDLGQDFQVRGSGLITLLEGSVELTSTSRALAPRLTGTLRTAQGTYKAYGQQLDIEEGVLRFTGAYDNPSLDILAIRPNLTQRVGVQISGTALLPVVRLYADPDLPDSEKLAWLLLGRSGANGGAEAAMLQQAALALLGKKGGGVSGGLADAFGLDEISLRGGTNGESTASGSTGSGTATGATVLLGKRLSRDFYVAYERSLAGTVGTLSIFYDLSRRFTLRAQTGEQSAVDLIFTLRYD